MYYGYLSFQLNLSLAYSRLPKSNRANTNFLYKVGSNAIHTASEMQYIPQSREFPGGNMCILASSVLSGYLAIDPMQYIAKHVKDVGDTFSMDPLL